MVDPARRADGAPPRDVYVEKKKNWLPWLLLPLALLALLFLFSRGDNEERRTERDEANASVPVDVDVQTNGATADSPK